MDVILQPEGGLRLGEVLLSYLADDRWVEFHAAVAFVRYSGVRHIAQALAEFAARGTVRIAVGVDFGGSTVEGLKALLDCVGDHGEVWVCHNAIGATFHPKLYLFKSAAGDAHVVCSSGNMTQGGMFTNYEAGVVLALDPAEGDQSRLLQEIERALDAWCDPSSGLAKQLDMGILRKLADLGYAGREAATPRDAPAEAKSGGSSKSGERLFAPIAVPKAPAAPKWPFGAPPAVAEEVSRKARAQAAEAPTAREPVGFLMTLQRTDAGVGQTTAGTSRRSPEIFIPLAARDHAPDFWGWTAEFTADAARPGKMDRRGVRMWLGTGVIEVNMMTWPDKHDFRLRCEALRSAGNVGDILRLEKTDAALGFDYTAYVILQGTPEHRSALALCVNKAAGKSKKLWGYY